MGRGSSFSMHFGFRIDSLAKKSAISFPKMLLCPLHQLKFTLVNKEKNVTNFWISWAMLFFVWLSLIDRSDAMESEKILICEKHSYTRRVRIWLKLLRIAVSSAWYTLLSIPSLHWPCSMDVERKSTKAQPVPEFVF